ncbi:hypothetical protein AWB81_02008 [Caballeronia arationis]|jgi:hypothetical protein|uniref:Uncharacterized protein n=1 Tax=Caballeronia arationis TaxID=1777142 RepID=A0A7Z7N4R1_9BURK|nr:hypothetical protein [Caballeronia arationis]SAK60565.1 hypothetical protein AWB81_02008 [Caballeronia arationis]SOE82241.1 hypothetical protein SAMN05446927_5558 [Caballeronia arationis]
MHDFSNLLVGLAALLAVAIVAFAHDWREEHRQRMLMRPATHRHSMRDWWMRHRH